MELLKNLYFFKKRVGFNVFGTLLLAGVFSLFAIFFTNFLMNQISDVNKRTVAITDDSLIILQIKSAMSQAESAQRGYLLTHRKDYLEPFESNIDLVHQHSKQLSLSTSLQSPTEKALLVELIAAVNSKITEMKLATSLQAEHQPKAALNLVNLDQGLVAMQNINEIENKLFEMEKSKLLSNRILRNEKIGWAKSLIIASILILLLVIGTSFKVVLAKIIEKDLISQQLSMENQANEKKIVSTKRQLQTLALDAQGAIERERIELARELHDELGSILTATKMDLSWVIKKTKDAEPDIQEKIARTIKYLDRGIQFKRQIVEAMHPSMIATFGIWPAIKNLAEESAERNEWQLKLTMPDEPPQLNDTLGLIAYRIIQETLNNASKYAKATQVTVEILTTEDQIKIEILDNGVGVDLTTIKPSTHGLSGMTHRVQAIGGSIQFESSAGNGMFTRAMLPVL
jgi:signal transduction histidine kinase